MDSWRLRLVFLGMSVVVATAFAAQVDMPVPAPTSDHDTEATTNTVFFAGISSDRQFNLSLELNAASSNCVEIAFGRDNLREKGDAFLRMIGTRRAVLLEALPRMKKEEREKAEKRIGKYDEVLG